MPRDLLLVGDGLDHALDRESRVDQPVEQARQRAVVLLHAVREPMLLAQALIGVSVHRPVQWLPCRIADPALRAGPGQIDRVLGRVDEDATGAEPLEPRVAREERGIVVDVLRRWLCGHAPSSYRSW